MRLNFSVKQSIIKRVRGKEKTKFFLARASADYTVLMLFMLLLEFNNMETNLNLKIKNIETQLHQLMERL
jgi:hypothetical protein